MAKTKISEFSATPANNTDIDGINIAEGCAPSGINDAIRELMAQLKDWQSGTSNDPYVIGSSGSLTLNQGTANGVPYLNGSKVVTSGSALTFDGTNLATTGRIQTGAALAGLFNTATGAYLQWNYNGTANGYIGTANQAISGGATTDFGISSAGASSSLVFAQNTTEGMRLTSTGLGIGTSSPAQKLNVVGNVLIEPSAAFGYAEIKNQTSTAGSVLRFTNGSTTSYFGKENSTGTYTWSSGGTAYATVISAYGSTAPIQFGHNTPSMTLDSSGNLGLGVTPSAWTIFKVMQYGNSGAIASVDSSSMNMFDNAYYDGAYKYILTGKYATRYEQNQTAGEHRWYTAASGTAGNAISFTQAMTLDASGNLLVGATSNGNGYKIYAKNNNTSTTSLVLENNNGGYQVYTQNQELAFFQLNVGERARIDSSGSLLVGLTSASSGGFASGTKFAVNAGANLAAGFRRAESSGTNEYIRFTDGDDQDCGSIDVNATANTTAYTTSSDYRLKQDVAPMTGALAKVAALNPVTWNWKHAPEIAGQGFIAHELQAVVPDAVTGEKDAVDADGNPVYQGIDTSFLVATLTAAIQELKAEFDAYKATHP